MAGAVPFYPALWTAARDGKTEDLRQLLAGEVNVEERGGVHETSSMHEAASRGHDAEKEHDAVVLLLLDHGAQVSAVDRGGAYAAVRNAVASA